MTAHIDEIAPDLYRAAQGRGTPEQVLKSIVDGINTGDLDALMPCMSLRPLLRLSLGASVTGFRVSAKRWPASLR